MIVIGAMLSGFVAQHKEGSSPGAHVKAAAGSRVYEIAIVRLCLVSLRAVYRARCNAPGTSVRGRGHSTAHSQHSSLNQGSVMASGNPLLRSSNFEGLPSA
ncbi:MAG: hypothetical protein ACYCOY_11955, partial [Metallibacterium sp.]